MGARDLTFHILNQMLSLVGFMELRDHLRFQTQFQLVPPSLQKSGMKGR